MESIYVPNFDRKSTEYQIIGDELKHVKALRIRINERMIFTDGKGFSVIAELREINKQSAIFKIMQELSVNYENQFNSALALGILDNKDRMEFAVEKAVELGINAIYPFQTRYSQKNKTNTTRLQSKAIAAMKQCKRSFLPEISEVVNLKSLKKISENYSKIVLLDGKGMKPSLNSTFDSVLLIVGPEGGFSEEEIQEMVTWQNLVTWNLGSRRLRAETAVITGLTLVNFLINNQ